MSRASEIVDRCEAEQDHGGIRAIQRGDISYLSFENESGRRYRMKWIEDLLIKVALCGEDGWFPGTPQSCRDWFSRWPEYTPKKEYEQKIYELQKELGIEPSVPRHVNLCPCTLEQGKAVNSKFEEVSGQ